VSPPTSNEAWAGFVKSFVTHLADRYGSSTVRSWPFEVWNEPNLGPFWSGTKQQYLDLYKATSVAIKSIDSAIQVGGPATATAEWLPDFASFCAENNAPVDFISTHVYAGDSQAKLFHDGTHYPQTEVIPEAVGRARQQVDASPLRGTPLWLTEWSSDSPAMIAHVIAGCLPHCEMMSQWALSSTFEEIVVPDFIIQEGDMGWGMMARGIALPSFNTYKLLHALGTNRLAADGPVLASRRSDGSTAALIWNLADVEQASGIPGERHARKVKGEPKRYQVHMAGARAGQRVQFRFVDQERGSPIPAWREMGSPQYLRPEQIKVLRQRAEVAPPKVSKLDDTLQISFDLPAEGVALIELSSS